MKGNLNKILAIICSVAFVLCGGMAFATTIDDNYIGADPTDAGLYGEDVIGVLASFDIYSMDVSFTDVTGGVMMSVSINSAYMDNLGILGTELGDLFISTDGYNPVIPTADDYYYNGEDWEYAVDLDDNTASSGYAALYAIDDGDIILSDDKTTGSYRSGQEVQIDASGLTAESTGTWSISGLYLDIEIFIPDSVSLDPDDIAFHWAMSCANDVIEGKLPVPEPATMLLLGTGLLGMAGIGRKKIFRK